MDNNEEIAAVAHAISTLTARHDAMMAVLTGMLEVARASPEVAKAIKARLDEEYSIQSAKAQSDHYMLSFEVVREYFRVLME